MDFKAFDKVSYGLYVVSSIAQGMAAGCIVNTFGQVTVSPVQITVAVNKENFTTEIIEKSGVFAVSVLCERASMELIGRFGFQSSKDMDKFDGVEHEIDENGVPYLTENCAARFACKVVNQVDIGTHILFIGEVVACDALSCDAQMTYEYYHTVKKGLTPPKASSYREETVEEKPKGWRCTVCGYIYEGETLPENYLCPICHQGADKFVKL